MCGITGFYSWTGGQDGEMAHRIGRMNDTQAHRGPDAAAVWVDGSAGIAFGHRRLAIVDLTDTGLQPMHSACGRWVICYNGEVYNAGLLKEELTACGASFRGTSDTEVILEAVSTWGVEETLPKLIGQFAIALWDRKERRLWLIRDRLGIKPLYWTRQKNEVVFGQELKSLLASGAVERKVDEEAVTSYMRFGYVPTPRTIFQGVHKLEAGCFVEVSDNGEIRHGRYWDLRNVALRRQANRSDLSDAEAVDALESLLEDAVQGRMIADVPLGAFLSGGIDSSTVVAMMQKASNTNVRTFTIGFDEAGYDEAGHARAVADHLGTDHTELYVDSETARSVIPKLPRIYDEPFADSSQIPTFLVSEMTRKHVTVALSGDGGDEVFAGYTRYAMANTFRRRLSGVPACLRSAGAGAIRAVPPGAWNRFGSVLPSRVRPPQLGDRLHKLANVLPLDEMGFYRRLVSHWENPTEVMTGDRTELESILDDPSSATDFPDFIDRMTYWDTKTYLVDDILTKVDRASLAVALEVRVPIIDHRVVEFAWSLPLSMKLRHGKGKWLLRQLLYRYVPRNLVERPKAGFAIPLDSWLRGPLKEWAGDLLNADKIRREGMFDADVVSHYWNQHLSGTRNWHYALWVVLMFQAWRDEWMSGEPPHCPSSRP